MTLKERSEIKIKIRKDVMNVAYKCFGEEYAYFIMNFKNEETDENSIINDIVNTVEFSSGSVLFDDVKYEEDDLKYAIGKVFLDRLARYTGRI